MSVKFSVIRVQAQSRHQFTLIPGAIGHTGCPDQGGHPDGGVSRKRTISSPRKRFPSPGPDLWEVHGGRPREGWEGKAGQIPRPGGAGCGQSWAEGRGPALPLNRGTIIRCWPMAGSRFCGHPAASGVGKDAAPEKGRCQVLVSTVGGSYRNLAQAA